MRRWWLLGIRNWRDSPGRCVATVISVALGVGAVVILTTFHETAHRTITLEIVPRFLGRAHLTVHPPGGHWGKIDSAVAESIRGIDNVAHVSARLHRRMRLMRPWARGELLDRAWHWVDAFGLDEEGKRYFVAPPNLTGRMIDPGERDVALMERQAAGEWRVGIGGSILLSPYQGGLEKELKVIGLFDSERVADFQASVVYAAIEDVQELGGESGTASIIEVMVKDASPTAIRLAQQEVERVAAAYPSPYPYHVESAAGRQTLLDEAERIHRFGLILAAFLALLTSFFIIVTTMGMSLIERRSQLGLMRCVGVTRGQLSLMVLAELVPLGLIGVLVGALAGVGLAKAVPWLSGGMIQHVHLSEWGISLAAVAGLATILLSAGLLMAQVGRVQPLAVVHGDARPARLKYVVVVGVIGVALLFLHEGLMASVSPATALKSWFIGTAALSLYLGYVLMAPALVVGLGPVLAYVAGPLLGIRRELARDQFGRAPWRSGGVCWVLLVGLSLIVYIGISTEAILAIWDFPARLPETFVWARDYVPSEAVERVRRLPGVREVVTTTDVECQIVTPDQKAKSSVGSFVESLRKQLSRPVFVAGEPDQFLHLVRIVFLEGDSEEAVSKLKRGGYVLIPVQTSRQKGLHLGDKVNVTIGLKSAELEIAGVVQSPALDMAVTSFQAQSYMQIAAASALLGTPSDLRDKFGFDGVSMLMCNLDLPDRVPPSFDPARLPDHAQREAVARALWQWGDYLATEKSALKAHEASSRNWQDASSPEAEWMLRRLADAIQKLSWSCQRESLSREEAWAFLQECLVLRAIVDELDRPDAIVGSLHRLRSEIDHNLRVGTRVLTWLPTILLVVAAIGIANLMMVNIRGRARQLAILRAAGALQSQIVRLVLSEAVILGVIGGVLGVALGLHEAWSRNRIVEWVVGFQLEYIVPVPTVVMGVVVTVVICLLAAVGPARHAARSNVVEAIQKG